MNLFFPALPKLTVGAAIGAVAVAYTTGAAAVGAVAYATGVAAVGAVAVAYTTGAAAVGAVAHTTGVAAVGAVAYATGVAAASCGRDQLDAFVAKAQELAPDAAGDGKALLACPALRPVAIQWLAFDLYLTGDHAGSRKLDDGPFPKSRVPRDDVINRAKAGDWRDLQKHVQDQDSGYATTADAQLALARVLTRKGDFAKGREAYLSYLRLQPDDDDALAEYLYSFLWEGRLGEAEGQLAGAARWSSKPEFAAAVKRGQKLLARMKAGAADGGVGVAGGDALVPGLFRGSYGQYLLGSAYRRRTGAVEYAGRFDVRLAGDDIDELALAAPPARASELWGGATLKVAKALHAAAHAGFFSLGTQHWFGDASGGVTLENGLGADLGYYRTPLALQVPLSPDVAGLMREAIFATLRAGAYVEAHGELQQEADHAAHERYTLLGRVPLKRVETRDDALYLRLPFSYESNPRPSPDYLSDPKVLAAGAGLEFARAFTSRWLMSVTADYAMAFITDRNDTEHTRHDGVVGAAAKIGIPLGDLSRIELSAQYYHADQERDLVSQHLLSGASLGFAHGEP